MNSTFLTALLVLAGSIILFVSVMLLMFNRIKKEVEKELERTAGDDEAQAEIRRKVVRAVFPPRFPRNLD